MSSKAGREIIAGSSNLINQQNMIIGIGIDMIETARVEAKVSKENGFRELVFSAGEIAYCEARANKYEHYGARFAVKEALFKALGTGWTNGTSFNEIEIRHEETGQPRIFFLGRTAETLAHLSGCRILVSLTHVREMAAAVVVIEKMD